MFTNVVARWPGSTHDSDVFRTSDISTYLQNNHHSLDDGVLLGDSGYAWSPFLMTPYTVTRNAAQEAYVTTPTLRQELLSSRHSADGRGVFMFYMQK